jgi:hypothetical protein
MRIKNVKEVVEHFLKNKPKTRDSDNLLITFIWAKELGDDLDKMTAIDFLNKFSANELPNFESIRRMRQKLQELNPEYRGATYINRMGEQRTVKAELKQIKENYLAENQADS